MNDIDEAHFRIIAGERNIAIAENISLRVAVERLQAELDTFRQVCYCGAIPTETEGDSNDQPHE